ncbi:MAG: glycoside hydrolase family 3 N-terminal domain-containing protein [Nakamurella sp.]
MSSEDMAAASAAVAGMSIADQAGTVVMVSSADAVGADMVAQLHLGGVILMGSNGEIDGTSGGTPQEVAAVTAELQGQVPASQRGAPLLIATDQEYGLVTRLVNGFTDFPGAEELSGISDTAAAAAHTKAVTAAAGAELLAVGVNVDFAPDADVLPETGPSGIDDRSFGSDPERTGTLVAAAVQGYQSAGLAATIKHFPGIGRTATDTHKALPTLDESCAEWNSVESVPMRAGVDAGVALVMTGHIALPAVGVDGQSSALASATVTDLLKGNGVAGCNGLNFNGVSVSDSFEMAPVVDNYGPAEAAARGIAAGQDLVLMPVDPVAAVGGISGAVANGSLPAARLQDAATAVYALRLALARSPRPGLEVVGSADHAAIAAQARAAG